LPLAPTAPITAKDKPVKPPTPRLERLPDPAPETLDPDAIKELGNLSHKILGPLRMPDADIIIEVVIESAGGDT